MVNKKAWLSFFALINSKAILLDLGQDSVQAIEVHPPQTLPSMSLWAFLCAVVHSHVGKRKRQLQAVPTKLGP